MFRVLNIPTARYLSRATAERLMTPAFNAYAALALAIVFEVTASALLQQSAQFTRPWPTLGMVLLYVASFYALSVAIRVIPLSIAYAIWGGVGIILTATVSFVLFRQMLDAAAIAMDHGVSGVTVQAVAAAAGVTKGGLFHHFGSKQALIEGLFADLLARVDAEIDAAIETDPKPRGSFTRAYVNAVFTGKAFGFATPWAALSMVVVTDPSLRRLWNDWMKAR